MQSFLPPTFSIAVVTRGRVHTVVRKLAAFVVLRLFSFYVHFTKSFLAMPLLLQLCFCVFATKIVTCRLVFAIRLL